MTAPKVSISGMLATRNGRTLERGRDRGRDRDRDRDQDHPLFLNFCGRRGEGPRAAPQPRAGSRRAADGAGALAAAAAKIAKKERNETNFDFRYTNFRRRRFRFCCEWPFAVK